MVDALRWECGHGYSVKLEAGVVLEVYQGRNTLARIRRGERYDPDTFHFPRGTVLRVILQEIVPKLGDTPIKREV